MIINKDYNRKVSREYFYIEGNIEIDSNYFINAMEKGFIEKNNMNYKTNVIGKMTRWNFFNNDPKLFKILQKISNYLDSNYELKRYYLHDAWGLRTDPGEKTDLHQHLCLWSGIIYLNKCNQPLKFPEINQTLIPEKGNFAIFSPWLQHGCGINEDSVPKYGISFNFREIKPYSE